MSAVRSAPDTEPSGEHACRGTLTRRSLLAAGFAAPLVTAGWAGATTLDSGSTRDASWRAPTTLVGLVEEIGHSSAALRVEGRRVDIDILPSTEIWRDGPQPLSSFEAGEEVAVEGDWNGERFSASALGAVYRRPRARIVASGKGAVRTPTQRIVIGPNTKSQRGLSLAPITASDLSAGDLIDALGRVDVRTGDLVALRIYR